MAIAVLHSKGVGIVKVFAYQSTFNLRRPPEVKDTDVTDEFSLKECIDANLNTYFTRYGNVSAGQEYVVICVPVSDNLEENFLFTDNDGFFMEATEYVEKVCDMRYTKMYSVTIPEGCEMLHINHTEADFFAIHLLNKEEI